MMSIETKAYIYYHKYMELHFNDEGIMTYGDMFEALVEDAQDEDLVAQLYYVEEDIHDYFIELSFRHAFGIEDWE
jgi:hypothetical protein